MAWKFLRHLAELIEVSYRTWWPGQAVAFASDNWQTERSWSRGRLGQSNNKDTNILQQAEYKIAWPLVEWHVLGDLHTFGLRLKPFDDLRLDDFKVDGGQTVFAKLLSEFHLVQGTKGRTLVQRKLYTLECSIHVEHYPSKLYTKPTWNFLTTEDGTGPAYTASCRRGAGEHSVGVSSSWRSTTPRSQRRWVEGRRSLRATFTWARLTPAGSGASTLATSSSFGTGSSP